MTPRTPFRPWLGTVLLLLAACSGDSSGGVSNSILTASQDLTVDPFGVTTVLTFNKNLPANLGPGNFEADGGQLAVNVLVAGQVATVLWDDRVTPNHQVRAMGIQGANQWVGVTTTDAGVPTFTVTDADQNPGLGGDTITVQFAGPYVVETQVEDVANWDLVVNGTSMDLTGSTFDLNPVTQVLDVTLGTTANLHATFDLAALSVQSVADVSLAVAPVAGVATGDAVAPTMLSAAQNLAESEFGFVVDFTFDEAMDPVFAEQMVNFDAGFPVFASQVEQPVEGLLRVTFTAPIVPGVDTIDLDGAELMDAHGNPVAGGGGVTAIAQGTTVANAFDGGGPVLDTVENQGGDTIQATFVQALDPDTAEEPARWLLESPTGTPVDISGATFDYDLLTKALTVTIVQDLVTADSFTFGAAAGAPQPMDVDGQDFVTTFAGTVTGDAVAPSAVMVTQDRLLDDTGLTLEVELSEDVDAVAAETPANWTVTGGATVQTATLLAGLDRVRLVLDVLAIPGEDTVDVQNLADLAGNVMGAPQTGIAIGSTDSLPPTASSPGCYAFEGADNDTVTVTFDDEMIDAEVTDVANWIFESPTATPLDTTNASVVYDSGTGVATLTFDGGDDVNVKGSESYSVRFVNMRDLGGNVVDATALTGTVGAETNYPTLEAVWVETADPSRLHVQFSEPCDHLDDIAGLTEYVVRDDVGFIVGGPASVVVDADDAGATLLLGFGVTAGFHTLDVRGVADLAGNQLFPVEAAPILAEDATAPALDAGISATVTVSGEENDVVTVEFDRPMSRWQILDPSNYDLDPGGSPVDLSTATFSFDGVGTVTIDLDAGAADDLETGTVYTLTVDGLRSAQGVGMAGASADTPAGAGDATPAVQTASRTRLDAANPTDSVLVEFDEAVDATEAADVLNYTKGGVNPDSVTRLGHRTVRATWIAGVTAGEQVDVTMDDLAGNAGVTNQLAQAADTSGPVVLSVAGLIEVGFGGDRVSVEYDEPVDPGSAGNPVNYTITQNGGALDLTGAAVRYQSGTNTIFIELESGVELDPAYSINVVVDNVANQAGIVINPPADINGTVTGDATPPDFVQGFVNYRADATGLVVDVQFTEDVDPVFAETPANFVVTGGQTVVDAELLTSTILRLTLSAALSGGDLVETTGIADAAGNAAATIDVEPDI